MSAVVDLTAYRQARRGLPEPRLTREQLAGVLACSTKKIYRLQACGLPGRKLGGRWVYVWSEVEAWMEEQHDR